MEQELEAVDGLLDSYSKFADTKLLSDVTVKMNDLFVILQSRAKEQVRCSFFFLFSTLLISLSLSTFLCCNIEVARRGAAAGCQIEQYSWKGFPRSFYFQYWISGTWVKGCRREGGQGGMVRQILMQCFRNEGGWTNELAVLKGGNGNTL